MNLSPKKIYERTGWSRPYISKVRHGRISCFGRIDEWANLLDTTPSNLLRKCAGRNFSDQGGGDLDVSLGDPVTPPGTGRRRSMKRNAE